MSLDVYLTLPQLLNTPISKSSTPQIYIRTNGSTKSITREEWDELYPDREPIIITPSDDEDLRVYHGNITHNLNKMAQVIDLYQPLWHPEQLYIKKAYELIPYLSNGYLRLMNEKDNLLQYNPSNEWGSYEGLLTFVKEYLQACIEYPNADISTWV